MQLLCPITEWKTERVQRGRAAGKDVASRMVVAADNWNWCIGTQRGGKDDAIIVGEKFMPSMRILIKHFFGDRQFYGALDRVVGALAQLTGIDAPERKPMPKLADWESYGTLLDDTYGTSYGREMSHPPQVLKRLFGKEEKE